MRPVLSLNLNVSLLGLSPALSLIVAGCTTIVFTAAPSTLKSSSNVSPWWVWAP